MLKDNVVEISQDDGYIEHSGAFMLPTFPTAFSVILEDCDSGRGIYLPLDEGGLFPSGCNVY